MAFSGQVEDYIGTFSDTAALTEWLTAGAKKIVDLLPLQTVEKFTADLTAAADDGIATTGHRVIRAHKSDYNARKIWGGLVAQAGDSDSIHAATSTDPVYYEENGIGFVLPGGGTIIGMAYPTVAYTATSITKFPLEYENAVILYAAIQGCLQLISTSAANVLSNVSYTKPTQTFDITQFETFLETNKDPELAQIQLGRLNHELGEFQTDIQNEQSEESVKLQTYVNETQNLIALYDRLRKEYEFIVSRI